MKKTFFYCFCLFFLIRCANVVTPTGGEKDIIPPHPTSYIPDSNSVFFTSNTIKITFQEYISLNDVFNQIIISPPLDEMPEYKLKGKTLTIEFKSPLKDYTTYTINFGQSIKDITEGNILENFTYVFSTGNYIDSLQVSGKVTDLLTSIPSDKAFVLLYFEPTDSSFTTAKPYYFAKTNKSGEFKIRNIKPGRYRMFAIEDQNFNYYYDLPNEKIAFQTTELEIDSTITNQKLQLYLENKSPQNLLELKSTRYGQARFVFSKPADSVVINYTGSEKTKSLFTHNISNDTLYYWNSDYNLDTFYFQILFDTTQVNRIISVKSFPSDSDFHKNKNIIISNVPLPPKGTPPSNPVEWDINKGVQLHLYNPSLSIDTSKIIVFEDSSRFIQPVVSIDSNDSRNISINYKWKPEKVYSILILPRWSTDIFGLTNDTLRINLKIKKEDAYGSISINFKNGGGNDLIFQLMKYDLTIIEEKHFPSNYFAAPEFTYNYTINYLPPAIYKMRLIVDLDKNGKWTPGDFVKNRLPEPVIYYPVDQNTRANWEDDVNWEVNY